MTRTSSCVTPEFDILRQALFLLLCVTLSCYSLFAFHILLLYKHSRPSTAHRLKVTIATGSHLFPSRTEQLSPSAPMVLPFAGGRVGRCQLAPPDYFGSREAFLLAVIDLISF